jgi:hypothetical protein
MNLSEAKAHLLANTLKNLSDASLQAAVEETFPPENQTLLHEAARLCCLENIPHKFLTKKTLSTGDKNGRTPAHLAACYGCLDQIPPKALSQLLQLRTPQENNVLHLAASAGNLDQIPPHLLCAELLLQPNQKQRTPLDCLIGSDQIELLKGKLSLPDLSKISHELKNQDEPPKQALAWFQKELHKLQLSQAVSHQTHGAL